MKTLIRLLLISATSLLLAQTSLAEDPADSEVQPRSFGACYTLYNCQGGSMGSFDDLQCRSYGGHSIMSGGLCLNL